MVPTCGRCLMLSVGSYQKGVMRPGVMFAFIVSFGTLVYFVRWRWSGTAAKKLASCLVFVCACPSNIYANSLVATQKGTGWI